MAEMAGNSSGKWGRVWRYEGKRAVVWRIRYRDASGRRVLETLGREPEWNRKRAQTKPEKLTFADFAERWLSEYLPGRGLKLTTTDGYRQTLNRHLLPYFGRYQLAELERRPELVDRFVTTKMGAGLAPKTVTNQLLVLQGMFKVAVRWRLMRRNPVLDAERPRVEQAEMNVLGG
jgi:hypothetical protein